MSDLSKLRRRIVRYRLIGYSPERIAELFKVPLADVRQVLTEHRLVDDHEGFRLKSPEGERGASARDK